MNPNEEEVHSNCSTLHDQYYLQRETEQTNRNTINAQIAVSYCITAAEASSPQSSGACGQCERPYGGIRTQRQPTPLVLGKFCEISTTELKYLTLNEILVEGYNLCWVLY